MSFNRIYYICFTSNANIIFMKQVVTRIPVLISLIVIGTCIGLMLGLSTSPVLGIVFPILLACGLPFVALKFNSEEIEKVIPSLGLIFFGVICGILIGLSQKNYDSFGYASKRISLYEEQLEITNKQAAFLFYFGNMDTSSTSISEQVLTFTPNPLLQSNPVSKSESENSSYIENLKKCLIKGQDWNDKRNCLIGKSKATRDVLLYMESLDVPDSAAISMLEYIIEFLPN